MKPQPQFDKSAQRGTGKLEDQVALITGGDSGIGRAIAVSFAKEEAAIAVVYLNEHRDAKETQRLVKAQGAKRILIAGDVGDEDLCLDAVERTVREFGGLDILVNNAAEQHPAGIDREDHSNAVGEHFSH
jgi:NAD(P)-dependent dehydrogenase (short-subunit alcohol dehydrogenase family)